MQYDVIILGAGASGLLCAMECAARGRSTLVIDHAPHAGNKIRIAGGGRCNCTNLQAGADSYYSGNPHFVKSALARFGPWDIYSLLSQWGIPLVEENDGKIFCNLGKKGGHAVANALQSAAERSGAHFLLDTPIEDVAHNERLFYVQTPGATHNSASLVIALGGLSWPQSGASPLGHRLAKRFGLTTTSLRPGLVPLLAPPSLEAFCKALAGTALPVRITLPNAPTLRNDLLFTHRGISGPAVLEASLFWKPGQPFSLDLLPDAQICAALEAWPKMELKNALAKLLPTRLAAALCRLHGWSGNVADCGVQRLRRVEDKLHAWPFPPKAAEGFSKAEVTLGGVDTRHISSKTMEANSVPGLYLTGEVLDVTGRLGGYNLQWAWSSGWVAGQYA